MPWNLQRGDLQRLTDIVKGLPSFGIDRDRRPILVDALGLSDMAREVVNDIALDGSPDEVARRIIVRLVAFGQLEDGRESLELFLIRSVVPKVDIGVGEEIHEIIKRCLINLGTGPSIAGFSWPETLTSLPWPMADHSRVQEAFACLLDRKAPWRFLPIRGPTETGKSLVTRQMLAIAIQIPGLACGRFDFKGTTTMDDEVRVFIQDLDVPLPPANPHLNERLGNILDELMRRARPTFVVFDTYEVAGEAQHWVEKQLLPSLIRRATWLRVVIAGQRVPEFAGAVWACVAHDPLQLVPPPSSDWFEYGKQHCPGLTLAWVEDACRYAVNKAATLDQILGPKK